MTFKVAVVTVVGSGIGVWVGATVGTGVVVGSGGEVGKGVAVAESPQATKTIATTENKAKIQLLFKRIIFTYPTPLYGRSRSRGPVQAQAVL